MNTETIMKNTSSRVLTTEFRWAALAFWSCLVLFSLQPGSAAAQVESASADQKSEADTRPEQLSAKDPNAIPASVFRLVDSVRSTKIDGYGAPIKLWEEGCKRAQCELRSRIDQNTQLYDREGKLKSIKTLKAHKNYTAIAVRFDDRGSGRIDSIYLMPKRR